MLANMDWYLLPVANPDGYEYSMTTVRVRTYHHGTNAVVVFFTIPRIVSLLFYYLNE